MRRSMTLIGTGVTGALLLLVAAANAADVEPDKLPEPIMKTIKARFVDVPVKGAAEEKDPEGKTIYEVSLDDKGKNIDLTLTPEGTLVLIEKEIARKDLPKPVAKTLDGKYPKAKYRICEEVFNVEGSEEKLVYYEALLVTTDKQIRAVHVAADGKVLKVEKQAADEED